DVFGNGMLLSPFIRLVAAFDHRHIFIDPSPDAATSFGERARLFALPRSSWDDYDKSLISAGGGVYPRAAKSIPITAEARAALGIPASVIALAPNELIHAILSAPVDLLWNGGIGTYVKATGESHADVGDKANDYVRVNGRELRAKVVGEGGNLGLTQRGRIEYALNGGRIATDFIDNSAGVDCSDHEVNIKILLDRAVLDGALDPKDRDPLLAETTDEVGELVLRDNYEQARTLGNSRAQARLLLPVHKRLIADLERRGLLDRALEGLPTDEELDARAEAGIGLTSPEFAVLLSYVKIVLEREILDSDLPDEEWTHDVLVEYFPTPLRERFAEAMAEHPLRREIVTTAVVNEAVNRGGTSFFHRATEETGTGAADILRAFVVIQEVYGLGELRRAVESLDNQVPTEAQTEVYLGIRRLLDRAVRWLVTSRRLPIDVPAEIARLKPGIARLLPQLETLFRGQEREALQANTATLRGLGLPAEIADATTRITYGFGLLDIVEVASQTGREVSEVARVCYVLSERFRIYDLLSRIADLPREDRWQTLARMALRYDLYAALAALTAEVLNETAPDDDAVGRVHEWEQRNATSIARTRNAIGEFGESPGDLAAISVLLRQIRTLVQTSAA
ncbi:NAD-glutamate dehydrogenase domain-containing protein, partial [Dactylosporangium sp. NPDC000244]|uniref:NAD-glutamate dehydrogenase domain-containing protein n=1 Tax=Dactylosporangium sp. NPDC000244 TaxID=3154365 RepID=UPI003323DC4C